MDNRIKKFDGIYNFRDFGGYATVDGRKIKANKLYRSAHLNNTNETDKERLAALDIGLIVDLRHAPERERQPTQWSDKQSPRRLSYSDPKDGESGKIAPHEAFMKHDLHKPEDARNYMLGSYGARPHDEGFKRIFGDTLRHMAETGDPILVHCAAGKDRTGTLCAVIKGALGVDENTIYEDFMLTMTAVDIDQFLKPAAQMFTQRYGRSIDPEAIRPMFGVEEAYLQSSLAAIEDMESYISDHLGITEKEKAALKAAYLE
ncbi:tyrosine-protein phosphatase [Hellea balneolensis]|uniref:tyrosine-protein phosphatase n=1 Tax=Hellea balneolensis TaxID=287478 RepID=UPI000414A722|nr:tyrosine-protein phosphatase [Hellea balneolensis]